MGFMSSINGCSRPRDAARALAFAAPLAIGVLVSSALPARADEAGVSFWLPGIYGSLASVPSVPGWSIGTFNYYTSVDAAKGVNFERGGAIEAGVNSRVDFQYFAPSYVFANPVLGGQASVSVASLVGNNATSIFGTLTGPGGATLSGSRSDSLFGVGDLYPAASLRWNQGVNNFSTYLTGDIPVGSYDSSRLANLGIGHGAIDFGSGYRDELSKRRGRASRLGRVAVSFAQRPSGGRRLCLRPDHRRQRLGREARIVRIARDRNRSANRIPVPGRRHAGLCEPQGLRRVRRA